MPSSECLGICAGSRLRQFNSRNGDPRCALSHLADHIRNHCTAQPPQGQAAGPETHTDCLNGAPSARKASPLLLHLKPSACSQA